MGIAEELVDHPRETAEKAFTVQLGAIIRNQSVRNTGPPNSRQEYLA